MSGSEERTGDGDAGAAAEARARLDEYLAAQDLEAVWFADPGSFAWLTGGDNVVNRTDPVGSAAVGYDGDGLTVATDTIEAPRLRAEQLPRDVDLVATEWYEGSLAGTVAAVSPTPAAADFDVPGFASVDPTPLRVELAAADRERYRALGETVAAAVESVCREASADRSERAVAADLRGRLFEAGVDTPVVLVGGSERAPAYRHPTPTDAPLGDYAVVSVTGRRDGLFASCTRTVAFDPPAWLEARTRDAMRVEATALAATREAAAGEGTSGDVFAAIRDAYADLGHPGEWERHHQGGATGYAGREWVGTPDGEEAVTAPTAYAWNPTVRGTKSEDTVLLAAGAFECLTRTGDWPTERVGAVGYDLTVPRHAPLRAD